MEIDFVNWIISFLFICLIWIVLKPKKNRRHIRNIKNSFKIIKKLQFIENNGQLFSYVRKIDPYVFEEVVLSSFQLSGCRIKRSMSYSGDGGVDGIIWTDKNKYLIQSKRYSKHINLQHVKDFEYICFTSNSKGIFIHTGKTGKGVWNQISSNITIISGNKLIELIRYNNINNL